MQYFHVPILLQHRVVGLVSTTIGYRCKQLQVRERKESAAVCDLNLSSVSPCSAQSSDYSSETVYRPVTATIPSALLLDTASAKSCSQAFHHTAAIDTDVSRKTYLWGLRETTPSTIAKRQHRISSLLSDSQENCESMRLQDFDQHVSESLSISKSFLSFKGRTDSHATLKSSRTGASGVTKQNISSSVCLGKEHKGSPVTQRVMDACRPSQLRTFTGKTAPTIANRTPVKSSRSFYGTFTSTCSSEDSAFSDHSESDDCFDDQAHVPIELLDAFSPVRPRSQLSAVEAHDIEMEFGWDPVVRNAVMKNVFDGFGAIRSY